MPLDSSASRLETAIASVNSATQRLGKIERALDETKTRSYDARRLRNECETQMHAARERESRRAVDELLGEASDNQIALADFENALAEADRDYEASKKLVFALQVEHQAAERALRDANDARINAIREVMNNHPSVVALYKQYAALSDELVNTNAALLEVFRAGGNPFGWRGFSILPRVERRDFDPSLRDKWQRAIQTLSETGELPEVE